MEKVICNNHGAVCMLKTGVKDGPNKGKSFYVCVDKQGCDFNQAASISPSHCLQHEDSMVELQALTYSQQQKTCRLFYRCVESKKAGQKWCGNVPWTAPSKEKRTPLSETHLQSSCVPPIRNPFKVPGKTEKDLEWRKIQSSSEESSKEATYSVVPDAKTKEAENLPSSNTYHGRPLPAGMKVKKSIQEEYKTLPKTSEVTRNITGNNSNKERATKTSSREKAANLEQDNKNTQVVKEKSHPQSSCVSSPKDSESCIPQSGEEDDDVVLVSVKPAAPKPSPSPPQTMVQKTLTTFPGFQPASEIQNPQGDPRGLRNLLTSQLQQKKATLSAVNLEALPDKGARLKTQVKELEDALESMSISAASQPGPQNGASSSAPVSATAPVNPFSRPGGTVLLPDFPTAPPGSLQLQASWSTSGGSSGLQMTQSGTQMLGANPPGHAFYGGRMTEDRLLAVKNATCEAIDHLHKSLESCPGAEAESPDPKGIKVSLLAHQKRALAWLLWRENQNPCGGILADDMGLGKTLTMISLILAKKAKDKEDKPEDKKSDQWISKKDSSLVTSKGTLIICPASLVHHWKKEIERHVKSGKLSVYLYHGPNREKSAKLLADHDVVVTTYSLVSKEVPPPKDAGENPSKDSAKPVLPHAAPLLRVAWARVVLDEAHNIKNPKVQTSMAVCQLRARARWAVTGTPIQNNLLDIYSLLKFLRCAPFDEYKLWKAQVDNGSKRGRERLNILTRTLLLRRTKDQMDSTGKPLVSLPDRTCEVHQIKLSEDEKAVYDVVFAQSRSTLQNYLKRHEGNEINKGASSNSNPFEKVAQEFGVSQADPPLSSSQSKQASSTVHILSLLLRLRQCCCHLSLLKKTLDSSELQGDGIVLSLEEQLNALSLSSSPAPSGPDPKDCVSLNGTRFKSQLFEDTSQSTKISAIVSELKSIRQQGADQKSVIVSQWTSMLHIVAVHLKQMGLSYAVIDGTVPPKKRMDLVEEFNTNPHGPQVMLVSLCAGGVGLNLIGGNHLFLIDMHWNPALEDQACDRIYRVGQRKDVTIHRFVCEGTVEDKISTLQAKKKELAQNVLSGTGSTMSKLSLADLRIIFGV